MEIKIQGLRDFTREMKRVDRDLGKELRQVHLKVAKLAEERTHRRMRAGGDGTSTRGVKGRATQKAAMLEMRDRPPQTLVRIWGAKRRSGWYARRRYSNSTRQHPKWVGNQWDPGESGGKPYYVGDAVNETVDDAIDLYFEGIDELARRAGFK